MLIQYYKQLTYERGDMQLAIINPLKGLYSEFVKITQGIEVKYSNKAEIHETLESSQHGDE